MPGSLDRFFQELQRRKVLRVVATYGVAAFGGLQGADVVVSALGLPKWLMTWLVVLVIAGLPLSAVLAWIFDLTPEGVVRTPALPPEGAASAAPGPRAHSPGRSWLALLLGGAAALLGVSGALLYLQRARPAPLARELVAVFPFTVRGAGQYAYLREGMVELLGTGLSVGGLRAVDERVLLRQLERGGDAEPDAEAARPRRSDTCCSWRGRRATRSWRRRCWRGCLRRRGPRS